MESTRKVAKDKLQRCGFEFVLVMGRIRFCLVVYAFYIAKRCTLVNEQFAYRSLISSKEESGWFWG